ncbi:PREDICTED: uncharacterized protein LOC109325359 isoform X3 [Lupinus angustifolius]|uniref:uncharacterized protein LOC109325359 isoform X3 n=1 Tax=Lupinus angustifolius TaxID=3871 RepID=UPI00092E73AB|nr:PREDICTED: uncharacterized protein LOC109325359 isoform X3 [Lupinus angustifolius]
MSWSGRLKEKHGQHNRLSMDNYDEESAARTRPSSLEDIMFRRKQKELLENGKDPAKKSRNTSPEDSSKKFSHRFHSLGTGKHHNSSVSGMEEQALKELVMVSSRKKIASICIKGDRLIEGKDRENDNLETKSSAGLNNKNRTTKESNTGREMHEESKTGRVMHGWRSNERMRDNSEYDVGNKHSKDSDRYAETNRPKYERKIQKKNQIADDESPNKYPAERKHVKDSHDRGKRKKWSSNDSKEVAEKKNHIDSADKHRHTEDSRGKYEREIKEKYRNGDDKTQDRNAARKKDIMKRHNSGNYEIKERREKMRSHFEESTKKRRRSRSQERVDRRRRSQSFSPRAQKHSSYNEEHNELSVLSQKDTSGKKHSDIERSRVSTNDSNDDHHRHGGSTSRLGGYSPRKRKSEAAVKTPSPSKNSMEKKRVGWDLPPVGTDNPASAFISSSFQLSNHTVLSNMHDVVAATSVDPAIVKPLPVSFVNNVLTGKNANIDSVQLTQATRPMRRLYLENLPDSASEKTVVDCFNNLLLPASVNHIQQAQPCISCILHKDRGQALVEFLTAEDASAALSFDGITLFGSTVKIRRPKDYVEAATGEPERSADASVTISEIVVDSPDKIFIGGISNHLSSEMLMEIAGAFGSLKAYHFETKDTNGLCAFLEYVDHSVTIKACAGLNGMKLAGKVLTVVQAMPDSSPLENGGKSPSYGIPEHAKPLLRKPTQVLKIKDVFTVESLSSLSDMAIEEILKDVRSECARFGTIKSLNVIKHSSEKTNLEECEVVNAVDSKEASQDTVHVIDNTESSISEKATDPKPKETSGVEFHYEKEVEEDKFDDDCISVNADKHAHGGFDNKSCQGEQLVSDATVEDKGNSIIQECPDHQDTPEVGQKLHDTMMANDVGVDIENKIVAGDMNLTSTIGTFREGFSEHTTSSGTELVGPSKGINEEDDISNHIFESGSVLVEFGRTEACCLAAHSLHGRFFDDRKVTVEYVALNLYRERFKE